LPTVAGISFLTGSQGGRRVQRTEARPFARELDVLPLPSRQLVDLSRYRRAGVMISSRGCPFRCIYCSASAYAGHRYRFRSPESVVAEMVHLNRDLGIPHVDIVDDTMTAVSHRTREICRQLARSRFAGTWRAFSRLDSLDHDLLAQMASCGCNSIFFGVESGDQGVLDAINKKVGIEDIVRVVDWTRQAGIEPECSFMVGHHADTSESIEATVALARRLRYECGVRLHPFFINTPFPGTALFEEAESFGVTILSQEWSDYTFDHCIINTKHLTSYEIQHWYFRALLELAPDGVVSPSPGDFDSRILLNTLMLSSLVSRKAYTPWLPEMADVNTREGGMSSSKRRRGRPQLTRKSGWSVASSCAASGGHR
jgi:anaerobic magnesium-protoporphyrin IX monomethyl ester cyclase